MWALMSKTNLVFWIQTMLFMGYTSSPQFAHEHTSDKLGSSIAHQPDENNKDWVYYYINM